MPVYSYAGLSLSSILPLPELRAVEEADASSSPDITVSILPSPFPEPEGEDWVHHWRSEGGDTLLSLARVDAGFLLRFPLLADFRVSAGGCRIEAYPAPETDEATLRHLLLDQVLPRVVGHGAPLVLHASAVEVEGAAVAFMGPTGWGKSTLAASFHAAGHSLLADDGLLVREDAGRVRARVLYPGLRLLPSSVSALFGPGPRGSPVAWYTRKERIPLEAPATPGPPKGEGCPPPELMAVFLLGRAPQGRAAPATEQVGLRDACMELIRHAFQLDPGDAAALARTLDTAVRLAEKVPLYRLLYPRRFDILPEVRAAVLDTFRGARGDGVSERG